MPKQNWEIEFNERFGHRTIESFIQNLLAEKEKELIKKVKKLSDKGEYCSHNNCILIDKDEVIAIIKDN